MTVLWIVICVLFGTLTFIFGLSLGFARGDSSRTQHGNQRFGEGYEKGMQDVLSSAERLLLKIGKGEIYKMIIDLLAKDYGYKQDTKDSES